MLARFLAASALACAIGGTQSVQGAPRVGAQILLGPASYIGVGVMDISDETARQVGLVDPHGIEISSVAEDSPGQEAGLQRGDIVLTYRGERVNGYEHFARLVKETPPGRTVQLGIVRAGQRQTLDVEIGRREATAAARETLDAVKQRLRGAKAGEAAFTLNLNIPRVRMNVRNRRMGLEMENLDGQLAEYFGVGRGVLVRGVTEGSPADTAGLQAGDVIVSVDGERVRAADDVGNALAATQSQAVDLGIVRDRERTGVRVSMRDRDRSRPGPGRS